jgi:RNA polymerase sigma-70 factor (ECF subfamily)
MADAGTAFREHHPAVYRYLVHLTGDPDLAADAAQEAFARLFAERPPPDRPKAWVFRVATNLVREAGRTRGRRLRLLESAPEQTAAGDRPPSPERAAERAESVARVRHALAALSERDRTLLLMRHEGFRHREIAEALGTTTGSVGTMIARALERLATRLDPDGEGA